LKIVIVILLPQLIDDFFVVSSINIYNNAEKGFKRQKRCKVTDQNNKK